MMWQRGFNRIEGRGRYDFGHPKLVYSIDENPIFVLQRTLERFGKSILKGMENE